MYKKIVVLILCVFLLSSVCYGKKYYLDMSLSPKPLPKKDKNTYKFVLNKGFSWMKFYAKDLSGAKKLLGNDCEKAADNYYGFLAFIYPEYGLRFTFELSNHGRSKKFKDFCTTNPDVKFSDGLYVGCSIQKVLKLYPNAFISNNMHNWLTGCRITEGYYLYCDYIDPKYKNKSTAKIRCILNGIP